MLYRPVDENGDMMPIQNASQMSSGGQAVRLAADARVALIEGEWWEDTELGFHMYSLLTDSARTGETQMLENYITSYLAQTKGCAGVTNVELKTVGRDLVYSCTLLADDGTSAELGVDQDVLFCTVY